MTAKQRLERAMQQANEITEIRRTVARLALQVLTLDQEAQAELVLAKDALLDEGAHHMDPHPSARLGVRP